MNFTTTGRYHSALGRLNVQRFGRIQRREAGAAGVVLLVETGVKTLSRLSGEMPGLTIRTQSGMLLAGSPGALGCRGVH